MLANTVIFLTFKREAFTILFTVCAKSKFYLSQAKVKMLCYHISQVQVQNSLS